MNTLNGSMEARTFKKLEIRALSTEGPLDHQVSMTYSIR